jgi:AcrR family transcriptional regulator
LNRRERKKEATRLKILGLSIELFRAKGFRDTSMEEIAEKADISKGTLYNYFENKESILSAYIQATVEGLDQKMESILRDYPAIEPRLRLLMDFEHDLFGKAPELMINYMIQRMQRFLDRSSADPFDNVQRSGQENLILKIITEAQKNKEIRSDIPAQVLARGFLLISLNYFISCQLFQDYMDLERLRAQSIEMFLNGAKS